MVWNGFLVCMRESWSGQIKAAAIFFLFLLSALTPIIGVPVNENSSVIQDVTPLSAPVGDDPAITWTNASGVSGLWTWSGNFFAWADFDADGDQDLLVNGGRLLVNSGAPAYTFSDGTSLHNLAGGHNTGAWGDIDNDGDLDLMLGGTSSDDLYLNSGAPDYTFSNAGITQISNPHPTTGVSLRDWNGDGWLDLYVMNGEIWDDQNPQYFRDYFYVNDQNGGFINRSDLLTNEAFYGRGISWGDYDRDFDSDLYVGNYRIVPNRFYENRIDTQTGNQELWERTSDLNDEANELEGIPRYYQTSGPYWGHTIASAFGDMNNDGYPEIVTGNLVHLYYDSNDIRGLICDDSHFYTRDPVAGTEWSDFRPNSGIDFKPRGGSGTYQGDELYSGVALGDVDNDGDLDMWLPQIYDLSYAKAELWINNGDFQFTLSADQKLQVVNTYGGTFVDYDNDGDLDLLTGGQDGVGQTNRLHLFRNDGPSGEANHWLGAVVEGENGAPAVGASIEVWRNGSPIQYREVAGAEGPHSSGAPLEVHFGLGADNTTVDLLVAWPDKRIRWVRNVSLGQTITIAHPSDVQPNKPAVSLNLQNSPPSVVEGNLGWYDVSAPDGWTVWLDVGAEGQIDNSTTEWDGTSSQAIPYIFENQGYRTTRLIAWDPATDSGIGEGHTIQVTSQAPTARVEYPEFILPATFVTFDAGSTGDAAWDRQHMTYRWEWDDGFARDFSIQRTYTRAFDEPGTYNLTLTARDETGLTDLITVEVLVAAPYPNGTLSAPEQAMMDALTSFSITMQENTPNIENVTYRYDWGDGSVRGWNGEQNASHVWTSSGIYDVNVSIRNEWEKQIDQIHTIEISNIPPTVDWTVVTSSADAGDELVFQVLPQDTTSHLSTLSISWMLDGTLLAESTNTLHLTIFDSGVHQITALVSDLDGASASISTNVTINALEQAEISTTIVDGIVHEGVLYAGSDTRIFWDVTSGNDWNEFESSGFDEDGFVISDTGVIIDVWSDSRQQRLTVEIPVTRLVSPSPPQNLYLCEEWSPVPHSWPTDGEVEIQWNSAFGWVETTSLHAGLEEVEYTLTLTLNGSFVVLHGASPVGFLPTDLGSFDDIERAAGECDVQYRMAGGMWVSAEAVQTQLSEMSGTQIVEWQVRDSAYNSVSGEFTIEGETEPITQTPEGEGNTILIPIIIIVGLILGLLVVAGILLASVFKAEKPQANEVESLSRINSDVGVVE